MSTDSYFLHRRLHSLLGVIPLGFFLVEHIYTNYSAKLGMDKYVANVEWLWSLPFLTILEFVFIFLPLVYHAGYGLYIASRAKNNLGNFGTFRNIMFVLQRVTGVITLVFVLWHLWETRVQKALYDFSASDLASHTSSLLQNKWNFIFYLVGTVSAIFHFSNGIWAFLVSWGITVGPRAQLISTWICGVIFAILSYLCVNAMFAFVSHTVS